MPQLGQGRLTTPVFVYDDYVDYLAAWFAYARRFGYSQKQFVADAGLPAHAFVSDILARRKKIGRRHVDAFCRSMGLVGQEAAYFAALVERDCARGPSAKDNALRTLAAIRESNLSVILRQRHLEYFAQWHYPVIREYLVAAGRVSSVKQITRALVNVRLSSRQIETALRKLEQWGLARRDSDGAWVAAQEVGALSHGDIPHAVVNDVKREVIEAGILAMETMPRTQRSVSMSIRGLSSDAFERFCSRVDQLRREFLELRDDQPADRVAALCVQLFPLARTGAEPSPVEES